MLIRAQKHNIAGIRETTSGNEKGDIWSKSMHVNKYKTISQIVIY